MPTLSHHELIAYLQRHGWVTDPAQVEIVPLDGGVSSAIHVVKTPARAFVVKQALEALKVKDDWRCDPVRNLYEQDYLEHVHRLLPHHVPALLHGDRDAGLFLMEFLGEGWVTWKERLWRGEIDPGTATLAGFALGSIHHEAWGRADVAQRFDNTPLFGELRIDPYLRTSAQRLPELAPLISAEADRLAATHLTLVHGDYSPKNLMTLAATSDTPTQLKILDAEVAWFGDPAFDIAFLTNHLWLKAIKFPQRASGYLQLQAAFLDAYRSALREHWSDDLEGRASRLVLMLMIARVAGKSPAGYFDKGGAEEQLILGFASRQLLNLRENTPMSALADQLARTLTS